MVLASSRALLGHSGRGDGPWRGVRLSAFLMQGAARTSRVIPVRDARGFEHRLLPQQFMTQGTASEGLIDKGLMSQMILDGDGFGRAMEVSVLEVSSLTLPTPKGGHSERGLSVARSVPAWPDHLATLKSLLQKTLSGPVAAWPDHLLNLP